MKELGKIVSTKLVRSQDYFARYGGEEFVAILNDTVLSEALQAADRVREVLASSPIKIANIAEPLIKTVSIGIAERKNHESVADLINRADSALYEAKDTGRNKVVAAS